VYLKEASGGSDYINACYIDVGSYIANTL